ncbi:MAG: thiamine diphosphokinase [Pseudomonadota bacterium]
MTPFIVDTEKSVTLVGGGTVTPHDIEDCLTRAPVIVAADGGATPVLAEGHVPDAVIGDLDSLPQSARAKIPARRLHEITDQDTTDFEKCLRSVRAPLILGAGFTGQRIDHELAVYATLVRSGRPCIILGSEDIVFAAPDRIEFDPGIGTRVSLFPMARVTGRSSGLFWSINGITFSPAGRGGTSNRATGPVMLEFDAPGMLVILPRACLDMAIDALKSTRP